MDSKKLYYYYEKNFRTIDLITNWMKKKKEYELTNTNQILYLR